MTTDGQDYVVAPFVSFFIGLDLGKTNDYTAGAVLERTGQPGRYHYTVTKLQRVRGKLFPDIIKSVQTLVADPRLRPRRYYPGDVNGPARLEWAPAPSLIVDAMGVGDPVTDSLLTQPLAATAIPLKLTGGSTWRKDKWVGKANTVAYWVAKPLLCSTIQSVLHHKRLTILTGLQLASVVQEELFNFHVKVNEHGNESFGAWRDGKDHDDLVLAIAMAVWYAEISQPDNRLMVGPNPLSPARRWGCEDRDKPETRRPLRWGQQGRD